MAEREQPLDGHARAQRIVGRDRAQPRARQPAHHLDHRSVPVGHRRDLPGLAAQGGAEDEAGRAMLAHGLHDPPLALGVLAGVGHERDVAGGLQRLLQADRQLREERVGEVVDDHGDHVAGLAAQIGGAAVVDVAEALDRLLDAVPGLPLDQRAVAQHERDGRAGHAGGAGQIGHRGTPARLSRFLGTGAHPPLRSCRPPGFGTIQMTFPPVHGECARAYSTFIWIDPIHNSWGTREGHGRWSRRTPCRRATRLFRIYIIFMLWNFAGVQMRAGNQAIV